MTAPVRHAVRRNAFEKERDWSLDDDGLSWLAADKKGRFDFSEIRQVRLIWGASRFDLARFECQVTRFNGWTETIVSTHYDGPAQFSSRAETYVPFVRELLRRLATANPACRFMAGSSPLAFAGNLAILLASLALLALVALAIGVPFTWLIAVKLVVIAWLVPLAIVWMKRNRPRAFDPLAIPADVLPAATNG